MVLTQDIIIKTAQQPDAIKQAQALVHSVYMHEIHPILPAQHPQGLHEVIDPVYGPMLVDAYADTSDWLIALCKQRVIAALCCYPSFDSQGQHALQNYIGNWQALDVLFGGNLSQSIALGRLVIAPEFRRGRLVYHLVTAGFNYCLSRQRPALTLGLRKKNVSFLQRIGMEKIDAAILNGVRSESALFIAYPNNNPNLQTLTDRLMAC